MTTIDKLDNLQEVFDTIIDYFDIDGFRLSIENDTTVEHFGSIYWRGVIMYEPTTAEHTIFIRDGEINYGDRYVEIHRRLFKFIEGLDVTLDAFTRTIIMILHEIGHANRWNTMYLYNQEDIMHLVDATTDGLLESWKFMMYRKQIIEKENIDLGYILMSTEMYADGFAMKHFYPVFKHLKSLNLF